MAWRRPGDKPLSEPMMVSLLTHLCVARPQWVKDCFCLQPCNVLLLLYMSICDEWWRKIPFWNYYHNIQMLIFFIMNFPAYKRQILHNLVTISSKQLRFKTKYILVILATLQQYNPVHLCSDLNLNLFHVWICFGLYMLVSSYLMGIPWQKVILNTPNLNRRGLS